MSFLSGAIPTCELQRGGIFGKEKIVWRASGGGVLPLHVNPGG